MKIPMRPKKVLIIKQLISVMTSEHRLSALSFTQVSERGHHVTMTSDDLEGPLTVTHVNNLHSQRSMFFTHHSTMS